MRRFVMLSLLGVVVGCGQAYGGKKTEPKAKATVQPCVAERIDEGVRITCPTSEAIVYDGAAGTDGADGEAGAAGRDGEDGADGSPGLDGADGSPGPAGPQGEPGTPGERGEAGQDGTSCTVTGNGVVQCGETEYQLPYLSDDTCQIWILPQQ